MREWTSMFYQASPTLMVSLFLICSVLAIALCMGIPIGNLVLGVLAGVYVGRRYLHAASEPDAFERASRKVGVFTGIIVAALAFPVGILALYAGEEETARSVVEAIGLPYRRIVGFGFVTVLCGLLLLMQYGLTRGAAWLA